MDQAQRDKILQNIDKLMKYTDYNGLMKHCIEQRMMFDVMQHEIEKSPDQILRHRKLLEKITRRGPKAYAIFEAILREKYPDAFDILNHVSYLNDEHFNDISIRRANSRPGPANQSPPNQNILNHLIDQNQQQNEMNGNHIENRPNVNDDLENAIAIQPSTSVARGTYNQANELTLTEFTDPVQPRLQFHVRKSTHAHGLEPGNKIPVYPMNSKNRGVLFLVNIINFEAKKFRKGAHADSDNLITLFREMGFKIFCYEDLTKTQFIRLVGQLVDSKHLRLTDCLVLALLSHGERDMVSFNVEFSDSQKMDIEEILIRLSNRECKYLVGKPKIFLFPFCRGNLRDKGIARQSKTESDHIGTTESDRDRAERAFHATYSDMKICYAAPPGYETFRDTENGSWYVTSTCQVYAEHAHDTHLDDMLKMIGNNIRKIQTEDGEMQVATSEERGFYNKLYFNPGYSA